MKYKNARGVLPEELLEMIQNYYQGGYLYIPKKNVFETKRQTEYKIELAKRNQHLYLKHLEGRNNRQLGRIFHLSESSVRRIISRERVRYQKMKEGIEQILPFWNIKKQKLLQIYPSAWEINDFYVVKVYSDKKLLERNVKISSILRNCNVPAAEILPTKNGETYIKYQNEYFLLSKKLRGSNLSDIKDEKIARKMGCAIAQLHKAFVECEKEIEFWDNNLLKEMKGWVQEKLEYNEWRIVNRAEYSETVELLEKEYDALPKQLIHRDVHFGNFLFYEGDFSGYVDFDLSQRNIRIFDICYFLAGLLAEETDQKFTINEWLNNARAVLEGYESIIKLSANEKNAIPYVMECIEILFAAYFIDINDTKRAKDAHNVLCFIRNCESDIKRII